MAELYWTAWSEKAFLKRSCLGRDTNETKEMLGKQFHW